MKRCCLALALLAAAANAADVRVIDDTTAAKCEYLDTVIGSSALYGVFANGGLNRARASALEKAAELGATHVVWVVMQPAVGASQIAAKAYKCNQRGEGATPAR